LYAALTRFCTVEPLRLGCLARILALSAWRRRAGRGSALSRGRRQAEQEL